jgi:hypothetical protein
MQVGKDLSSTTDILSGQQPAQNVASSTVSQLVEQGTKVFVSINKRLYRSLKREYQKLYYLNYLHLSDKDYKNVLNDPEADKKLDFNEADMDISPAADPTLSSEAQRLYRAGMIQQLRTVNPREADILFLQAMQVDPATIGRLLPDQSNEPPAPDAQKTMAEIQQIQANINNLSANGQLAVEKLRLQQTQIMQELKESEARIAYNQALVWKAQQDVMHNMRKDNITADKMMSQQEIAAFNASLKAGQTAHDQQMDVANLSHEIAKTQLEAEKEDDSAE